MNHEAPATPSQRPWLASYPPGVDADIHVPPRATVVSLMEEACRRYAAQPSYISMGSTLSYDELEIRSRHFAAWLQSRGIRAGSRVALMMPNLLQYPIALFGVLRAGGVAVNCNPLYTPRELEFQLRDSGAEAIVVLENFAHTLAQVRTLPSLKSIVVTSVGELLGGFKGRAIDFVLRHVKRAVPRWQLDAVRFNDALAQGAAAEATFNKPAVGPQDLAFLQYTGGTTGRPKGAMLSHANIVANLTQVDQWIAGVVVEGQERVVTALPLYHIFALTANCLAFMHKGAANLLIINPRDIDSFVKELERYPFTVLTGVNTLFSALLHHPRFARLDFSRLKVTLGGGMAVQREVADRWQQVTGNTLIQAYGLTETSPGATINPLTQKAFNGSIGLPLPSTEVEIRDEAGQAQPVGHAGEVCIRGPQVMVGYWNQPEETRAVFYPDGFLRTGDVGMFDEQGYVYLLDRKKDMIKVSGFNVYPNEIEDVVARHPGVREVAAIGVPDAHSGEAIKLYVVRRDPALTSEALIGYCRQEMTGYKVPRHVEFREDLPHTNVGKILRRALKEQG
ncbi:MAG: AMP-binding protein [Betaproteobacteria bacterium]|nr:AMP-binding protein [Betaproteobacteria bacterium]